MADTIYALSSGTPPAAIGVIRVSGPTTAEALETLAGKLPRARRASLRQLRNLDGALLDEALVLWFPGPNTATGEDLAEFHIHGGRAVASAVEHALGAIDGLRAALPGEFTRRAFSNGRIDLSEAEGLADLLEAETELQRASAIAMAGGALSRQSDEWRDAVLALSAKVESALDFSDEDDVGELDSQFHHDIQILKDDLTRWLERPEARRLREGYRVAIAGPPNAGKSTLFNALTESEAAITSPQAGTTRDVIERSVALDGIPFTFVDTAGLRDDSEDTIERIGITRAREQLVRADCILWLGPEGEGPEGSLEIEAQIDRGDHSRKTAPDHRISAMAGDGMDELRDRLMERARATMPKAGEVALTARQRALIEELHRNVESAGADKDLLLIAESLRRARVALDSLAGRASTEDMLDALFGRFCIGK